MRARLRWLFALCVAVVFLAGCAPSAPWRQESFVFGTRVELLITGVPEAQARVAGNQVLAEFDRLHRTYHAWQPSELSSLNAAIAAGKPHDVSPELAAYIHEAQTMAAASDYLFDPGIGRLIALWGFHTDEIVPHLPDEAVLKALLAQRPSIADLHMEGQRVTSRNKAVALDFGGYLKGVALDRAAAILRQAGIHDALINIGGNVMALGTKNGTPWRVGIQHPRPAQVGGAALASLELRDGEAIGTSGDYHRFFEIDGRRYCHLLDPRTGRPADGTQAVTILIAPGALAGMRSDALSKPLFIAGQDWLRQAQKLGVAAALKVGADGTVSATPLMRARLKMEKLERRKPASPELVIEQAYPHDRLLE
ncbi:MAG: FAD:protein FMN transferase [Rugosibacter sp.]|nr:FAD:protein FMN transferase [Rugosibacter sp.]